MNFVIDPARRGVSVAQWLSIWAQNPKVWGAIPHGDSQFFFFVPRSWQNEKKHLSLLSNVITQFFFQFLDFKRGASSSHELY